ncbi:MAG TPA: hypothetical protein VNT79_02505 [Phycisphaerae bacterium]|nr:hypothetical protein [Phycisphaerae bacterium]
MSKFQSRILAAALLLAGTERALGVPIEIAVNPAESVLSVQMCVGASCSTDTSPVTGFTALKLDDVTGPGLVELHDFVLALSEPINLSLTGLTATGQNISLEYATPGLPQPPATVDGAGGFDYLDLPSNQSGTVSYTASGFTCILLLATGYPCTDAIDLAEEEAQPGDFAGTITALPGRVVRVVMEPNVSGPVDPDLLALGTLTISGTIVGQAVVPLRGDANLNGVVDGADVQPFVDLLLNPEVHAWQAQFAVDMNDDDDFDVDDTAIFAQCLVTDSCN